MKSSRVTSLTIVVFLAVFVVSEGMSLGVQLHCRCIMTESRPMARHIAKLELIPASSHCEKEEIIATMRKSGLEVCLDPEAPWVKKMIERFSRKRR